MNPKLYSFLSCGKLSVSPDISISISDFLRQKVILSLLDKSLSYICLHIQNAFSKMIYLTTINNPSAWVHNTSLPHKSRD